MLDLHPCPSCHRHVVVDATACPFCAAALEPAEPPEVPIGAFSRAAVFAGLALASPACWTGGNQPATTSTQTTQTSTQTGTDPGAPEGNKPDVTTARVEGVVTNSRTGQALVSYAVIIRPAKPGGPQARTATDANGHYAFAKLPAGDYQLQFGDPMPRRPPTVVAVTLHVGELKRHDQAVFIPEPSNVPMPYGAPPARERIV